MKYFGTDGIRRIANTELTPELVYKVAKAGAYVLSKHLNGKSPTILIGRDTRISGTLIEAAMTAGFLSYGANVKLIGVIPTPGVAYLTKKLKADASVVISASHNAYDFNGIKYFSNLGMKIPDEIEAEIEEILDSGEVEKLTAKGSKIGVNNIKFMMQHMDGYCTDEQNLKNNTYTIMLAFKIQNGVENFTVAIDTANGATSVIADKVFTALGIKHYILNNTPNGTNINENCGSTHMEMLQNFVVTNKCDIGIAYDGDGDRCLAVNDKGEIIDGDIILSLIGSAMKKKGELKNNAIVATVMSNLGMKKFCENNDIDFVETKVGDRYVLENMLKNGYNLGGEQSGHVIFLDYNPTGDGILTSLMLIKTIFDSGKKLSELQKVINIYPQVLINAKVDSNKKYDFDKNPEIVDAIEKLNEEFDGNGRVLIRPSGTEPLVRVMIEGENQEYITKKAREVADLIEEKLK